MLKHLRSLPRDSRDTLFLLGVVAFVMLPQIANLPWWTPLLAALALGWRGWLAWHSRPLPARTWLLLLLLLAVGGTLASHRTLLGRDAGVTLVVVLLALKTLELRARRDAFVVFFLGFFTMLTNFFYSQSLLTAACMLLALLGLLTALVNAHLPAGRPPLRQSAAVALRLALLGTPVMVALFLLFPRMAPLWGMPSDNPLGRSGLSSKMEIGHISALALDDSIAMRLRFDNPGQEPPPQRDLYFRGPVYSVFDGREWKVEGREPWESQGRITAPPDLQVSGEAIGYEVTLEPHHQPWLLTLDMADGRPRVDGGNPALTPEMSWIVPQPVNELLRYHAVSHTQYRYGPAHLASVPEADTQLPPGFNPRTLQLALDMRRTPALAQADAMTLADAVLRRLATGGYSYTLEPGEYGRDTADEFWFDRKAGFCEHIASAFVVLMRALGVPARIVTGYQGGERNGLDGYWTVRQSDAHAWAEIWQQGMGWVRIDPTGAISPGRIGTLLRLPAPRGVVAGALFQVSPGLLQSLRTGWEALNNRWNQWVLNYTQTRQLDLLRQLGFESPSWEDLSHLLLGLVVCAALGGAAWSYWERLQHDPWLRLLDEARRQLRRHGLPVGDTLPPRALAAQALQAWGESARPLVRWLHELEALRYAPPPDTAKGAADAQRPHLARLRRQFRQLGWPGP